MEFQVQGSVLVDGEWVSRSADVYQIMSRHQQQEDVEMDDVGNDRPHVPSEVGILSKTVVGSPLYSTIIPANIRHKDLDDVIFIGEDFVQLKEICDYGHLRHIATKSDFKGKILAARAFGDPRKVQINTSEQSPLLKRASLHRARRSTTGEEMNTLPLEVIVLTLSTRALMFLWARDDHTNPATFAQKTIRLPTAASRFNRPGQFLAIDPRCRAIAVAAYEGTFMLYKTKTMEIWRSDMRAGHDEAPIIEEAQYAIDGRIMHMEFLSASDDAHVVLIFNLIHEGKTKVASYDWDFRNSLDTMPRITRSVLEFGKDMLSVKITLSARRLTYPDNRNPSLLIPVSRSTDFLLVQNEHISICKGVLAGPPVTSKYPIPTRFLKQLRPGSNRGKPLWVQWDRAPRNPDFVKEAFYVAREDGTVIYVELGDIAHSLEISDAGSWPYPIDTAFACLKADSSEFAQSYPDVLIAGGFGSDGHLCKVGAWPKEYADKVPYSQTNAFGFVESLPNWAPLTDMSVTRLGNFPLPHDRKRASIFVSNGKAPCGEVSQLRQGLRALVDDTFEGLKGSTGLWIVDHGSTTFDQEGRSRRQDYATFVVNAPPETLVLLASRTQEEGSYSQGSLGSAWDGGVWETDQPSQDGLIRHAETISACSITESLAVQVTYHEARLVSRPQLNQVGSITFPNPLLGAATKPGVPFIAVVFYEGTQSILQVIQVSNDKAFERSVEDTSRWTLPDDPTCIDILISENGPLIFVGIRHVGFSLFATNEQGSLAQLYHTNISSAGASGLQQTYESAVLLTTRGHEKLVCGTRTGLLICVDLASLGSGASAFQCKFAGLYEGIYLIATADELLITRMGDTAVYITPNKITTSTAFVACGADFCRIHLSDRDFGVRIDSIWLDDSQNSYLQGALNAIDQVPLTAASGKELGGFIFAVFGDRMVYARMDYDIKWSGQAAPPLSPEDGKIIPRKLSTTRTTVKLMVADDLPHHMIIVTNEFKEEGTASHKYRIMMPSIKVVDLLSDASNTDTEIKDESSPSTPKNKLERSEIPLKHYERVHSMVRWVFSGAEDRQHALLLVGTEITPPEGETGGRRLVLNITKSGLKLQDKKRFDEPVRCIAGYDSQHIISIVGYTLQVEQIERTEAASHDSHLCFRVEKIYPPQGETFQITQIFSDSRQRSSLRHLVFNAVESPDPKRLDTQKQATIVLLTDKTASVTGLLQPNHASSKSAAAGVVEAHPASNKSAATTMFEACLPRSVVRIQRGDIRPPWRRVYNPDTLQSIPEGVLNDDIIGACTDGTILSFTTLNGPALHLLRLLQNLIEAKQKRDTALQFSTVKLMSGQTHNLLQNRAEGTKDSNIKARDVDPEVQGRGPAAPRFRHVDGDVLNRFFEKGGDLRSLVRDGCDEDVWKAFLEKERAMLGELNLGREQEEVVRRVERWVKEILMPLL
ncbi:uncharacterized protein N0V89_005871 [Didymosphaeria variabile]|uniref:RSE1/DDB1/CPSF1 first beta-propeller domain-containing protein n=1 Tax=Didymosphaeria variabile TaxID=1932322 RepID=A0A9W8XNP9_9PLEO|nr:uncharacterized protein N0V89_005871 [Didymosphaeria variabile]KAJ4354138.1 hypothetical protein N0V89_005871 [Didymosphaeria variabile]